MPDIDLSMAQWADIAQYALAGAALIAICVAYFEIRVSRAAASRQRVYDYADTFNQLEFLRAAVELKETWSTWKLDVLLALPPVQQSEGMRLPNLIEEVAHLYNTEALDRDVAAELLGVYVEKLWQACEGIIREYRVHEDNSRLFVDWEKMQNDTWRRRGAPGPLGKPVVG
jgi:hypothetical protein